MNSDEKLRKIIEEEAERRKILDTINEMRERIDRDIEDTAFFDYSGDGPLLVDELLQSTPYPAVEEEDGDDYDDDDDDSGSGGTDWHEILDDDAAPRK